MFVHLLLCNLFNCAAVRFDKLLVWPLMLYGVTLNLHFIYLFNTTVNQMDVTSEPSSSPTLSAHEIYFHSVMGDEYTIDFAHEESRSPIHEIDSDKRKIVNWNEQDGSAIEMIPVDNHFTTKQSNVSKLNRLQSVFSTKSDTSISLSQDGRTIGYLNTTDNNDIGSAQSNECFVDCSLSSVWVMRLTGLYSETQLAVMGGYEADTILNSSVCGEVVQRNEDSLVLKVQGMGIMVRFPSSSAEDCLRDEPLHTAECSAHYTESDIAALQASFAPADQVKLQLLLMVLRDSPCFISDAKWQQLDRNGAYFKSSRSGTIVSSVDNDRRSRRKTSHMSLDGQSGASLRSSLVGDSSMPSSGERRGGADREVSPYFGCGLCCAGCGVFLHKVYVVTFRRHHQYRR